MHCNFREIKTFSYDADYSRGLVETTPLGIFRDIVDRGFESARSRAECEP